MKSKKPLNLRRLFEKYERLDNKRDQAFKELTETLNEILRKKFKEFNESSDSGLLITKWQVGITKDAYSARLSNGRVVSIKGECKLVIIVKELLDKNRRVRYDINNSIILTYEEGEKLQIELREFLDQKLRPSKLGYRHIKLYFFSRPNYPARYAEVISLSFFIGFLQLKLFFQSS